MTSDYFREMTSGEIILSSLRLFQQHAIILVSVTILPELILLGMDLLLRDFLTESPAALPVVMSMTVLSNAIALSAIITVISGAVLGGAPTFGQTYQMVIQNRLLVVVGVYFLTAFMTSAGLMLFILPGLLLGGLLSLAVPSVVVEGLRPLEAIQRSTKLVRSELPKAVTIFLFVLMISGLLPLMLQLGLGVGPLTPVLGALLASITVPLGYAATVIFYLSMRSREGYTPAGLEQELNTRLGKTTGT